MRAGPQGVRHPKIGHPEIEGGARGASEESKPSRGVEVIGSIGGAVPMVG